MSAVPGQGQPKDHQFGESVTGELVPLSVPLDQSTERRQAIPWPRWKGALLVIASEQSKERRRELVPRWGLGQVQDYEAQMVLWKERTKASLSAMRLESQSALPMVIEREKKVKVLLLEKRRATKNALLGELGQVQDCADPLVQLTEGLRMLQLARTLESQLRLMVSIHRQEAAMVLRRETRRSPEMLLWGPD